jgi:hypothetical protein
MTLQNKARRREPVRTIRAAQPANGQVASVRSTIYGLEDHAWWTVAVEWSSGQSRESTRSASSCRTRRAMSSRIGQVKPGRVGEVPVFVAFAGVDGAGVTAAHSDHHIGGLVLIAIVIAVASGIL